MKRTRLVLSIAVSLVLLSACGSKTPPPSIPAPIPNLTGQTGYAGGGCAPVSGDFPFRRDNAPYVGNLTPLNQQQGSSSSNSISLNLSYMNYSSGDASLQTIVASGMFYFPDMLNYIGMMPQGGSQPNSFCVTSADPTSGTRLPGVFAPGDSSIALTLRGIAYVPRYTYSPFDPVYPTYYPGSYNGGTYQNPYQQIAGTQPTMVQVAIGTTTQCPAWLNSTRIYGCVQVTIGNTPSASNYVFYYQSR